MLYVYSDVMVNIKVFWMTDFNNKINHQKKDERYDFLILSKQRQIKLQNKRRIYAKRRFILESPIFECFNIKFYSPSFQLFYNVFLLSCNFHFCFLPKRIRKFWWSISVSVRFIVKSQLSCCVFKCWQNRSLLPWARNVIHLTVFFPTKYTWEGFNHVGFLSQCS